MGRLAVGGGRETAMGGGHAATAAQVRHCTPIVSSSAGRESGGFVFFFSNAAFASPGGFYRFFFFPPLSLPATPFRDARALSAHGPKVAMATGVSTRNPLALAPRPLSSRPSRPLQLARADTRATTVPAQTPRYTRTPAYV